MMLKKSSIIILVIFLISYFNCKIYSEANSGYRLNLKQVITDQNFKIDANYEYGKSLYPQYKFEGLPDNFLIKKTSDVSIEPFHIKEIIIRILPIIPGSHLTSDFDIKIIFDEIATKEINTYTKLNLKKRVAIEIDDKILAINTVITPVEDELIFSLSNKSIQDIKNELSKISKNIIIETSPEESSFK